MVLRSRARMKARIRAWRIFRRPRPKKSSCSCYEPRRSPLPASARLAPGFVQLGPGFGDNVSAHLIQPPGSCATGVDGHHGGLDHGLCRRAQNTAEDRRQDGADHGDADPDRQTGADVAFEHVFGGMPLPPPYLRSFGAAPAPRVAAKQGRGLPQQPRRHCRAYRKIVSRGVQCATRTRPFQRQLLAPARAGFRCASAEQEPECARFDKHHGTERDQYPGKQRALPSIGSGYRRSGDARGSAQHRTTRQSSRRTRQQYRPPRNPPARRTEGRTCPRCRPRWTRSRRKSSGFCRSGPPFLAASPPARNLRPGAEHPRASQCRWPPAPGRTGRRRPAGMRREACDRSRLTATRMPMPRYWPAITCQGRYDGSARKPSRTSSPSILVEAKARTARQIRNSGWLLMGKSENRNRYSLSRGSLLISIPRGGAVSADFGWTRIWTIRSKYPTPSRLNRIGAIVRGTGCNPERFVAAVLSSLCHKFETRLSRWRPSLVPFTAIRGPF